MYCLRDYKFAVHPSWTCAYGEQQKCIFYSSDHPDKLFSWLIQRLLPSYLLAVLIQQRKSQQKHSKSYGQIKHKRSSVVVIRSKGGCVYFSFSACFFLSLSRRLTQADTSSYLRTWPLIREVTSTDSAKKKQIGS